MPQVSTGFIMFVYIIVLTFLGIFRSLSKGYNEAKVLLIFLILWFSSWNMSFLTPLYTPKYSNCSSFFNISPSSSIFNSSCSLLTIITSVFPLLIFILFSCSASLDSRDQRLIISVSKDFSIHSFLYDLATLVHKRYEHFWGSSLPCFTHVAIPNQLLPSLSLIH